MKKTNIYGFGYLEPADRTGELLDMDQRRFQAIENNLLHLYTIFGNGVLEDGNTASWLIQPPIDATSTTLSVYITPGEGHIAWKYAKTIVNTTVELPFPIGGVYPITYWIYATATETTPELSSVEFIASLTEINNPNYYVGLGGVTVENDGTNITYTVHNTTDYGRTVISLFATLSARINAHKHIGGTRNPSPIDLGAHVQGKLSGTYISDLDASTITSGTLAAERLPQIDHETLSNKGTLTHPEIDSLLTALGDPANSRLSDVFTANMMQLALALKKQSGLRDIDKNLINTIIYIPGFTPNDSYISYYSTWAGSGLSAISRPYVPEDIDLATIDKANHQIIGGAATAANSDSEIWTSNTDFTSAFNATNEESETGDATLRSRNIDIVGTGTSSYFTLSKPYRYEKLSDSTISSANGWKYGLTVTQSSSGGGSNNIIKEYLYLEFANGNTKDYSDRNKLALKYTTALTGASEIPDIECFLVFADGTGTAVNFENGQSIYVSSAASLHDTTAKPNPGSFYEEFDLDEFAVADDRKEVIGFGISYDIKTLDPAGVEWTFGLTVPTSLEMPSRVNAARLAANPPDTTGCLFVWNDLYYDDEGILIFRFDGNTPYPLYNLVTWDIDEPLETNTYYEVSTRVENTTLLLNGKSPSIVNPSNNQISASNNTGRYIDIIYKIYPTSTLLEAPNVNSVQLHFTSTAVSAAPKEWNTNADFDTGRTFTNILYPTSNGRLELADKSEVGYFKYIKHTDGLGAYLKGLDGVETATEYVNLSDLYTTPVQAFNHSVRKGLEKPRDAYVVTSNKHIIFADTDNDRIVEVDATGSFVKALQGNIRLKRNPRDLVALCAQYNPDLGKLWIAFSQYINSPTNLSNISISSGSQVLNFNSTLITVALFDTVTSLNDNISKSATLQVTFTGAAKSQLDSWSGAIYVNIGSGVISTNGNDGLSFTAGTGTTNSNNGTNLPSYIDGTIKLYKNIGSGDFASAEFVSFTGLITDTGATFDEGDFNENGSIDTTLIGPDEAIPAQIPVFVGNVVYDNIYSPLSIQVIESGQWVVAMVGSNSVKRYSSALAAVESKTISTSFVSFTEGKGGSAYLIDNPSDLTNRNLLIAAPAATGTSSASGKVLLINQNNSGNTVITTINAPDVDAVRALPDSTNNFYWVALNDTSANGINSRLVKYDINGNILSDWSGSSEVTLTHPVGLQFTPNGDILVSE